MEQWGVSSACDTPDWAAVETVLEFGLISQPPGKAIMLP